MVQSLRVPTTQPDIPFGHPAHGTRDSGVSGRASPGSDLGFGGPVTYAPKRTATPLAANPARLGRYLDVWA